MYFLLVLPQDSIIRPILRRKTWGLERLCYLLMYIGGKRCGRENMGSRRELSVHVARASGAVTVQPSMIMFDPEEFHNNNLSLWAQVRSDFKYCQITRQSFCQQKIVRGG